MVFAEPNGNTSMDWYIKLIKLINKTFLESFFLIQAYGETALNALLAARVVVTRLLACSVDYKQVTLFFILINIQENFM